jgi:hypothetical protein
MGCYYFTLEQSNLVILSFNDTRVLFLHSTVFANNLMIRKYVIKMGGDVMDSLKSNQLYHHLYQCSMCHWLKWDLIAQLVFPFKSIFVIKLNFFMRKSIRIQNLLHIRSKNFRCSIFQV